MSRFTPSRSRALTAGAVLAISVVTLTGCSAPSVEPDDGKITVVASTSVYGNLVATLGGDAVSVTTIIDNAAQDPHSYEATARDQLAVTHADMMVLNGGGYDPFAEVLYESAGDGAVLVNAVKVSGLLDDGADGDPIEGFNEHVWYSFPAVERIAENITEELSALDPASSDEFDANLAELLTEIDALAAHATQIAESANGRSAAVTEPVAVYLLEATGLHNDTPTDFTEAIEEGSDVPPIALKDVLELIQSDQVALLANNEQTASPETERVRLTAVEAGLPVVSFTETLPEGSNYVEWMSSNLDAVATALAE